MRAGIMKMVMNIELKNTRMKEELKYTGMEEEPKNMRLNMELKNMRMKVELKNTRMIMNMKNIVSHQMTLRKRIKLSLMTLVFLMPLMMLTSKVIFFSPHHISLLKKIFYRDGGVGF